MTSSAFAMHNNVHVDGIYICSDTNPLHKDMTPTVNTLLKEQ
jgi:hypothetical protein